MFADQDTIATRGVPECLLCGSPGAPLYEQLEDRLYAAPGRWNFRRCADPDCGLAWLDPMPKEEDLGKAYQDYYTHGGPARRPRRPAFADVPRTALRLVNSLLKGPTGLRAEAQRLDRMQWAGRPPGRLLEVGCGSGVRLRKLAAMGWDAEGQDVDPGAVDCARQRSGCRVHLGPVEKLGLEGSSYDAVVMNHVLEHLPRPVESLQECRRLLRPGGVLLAVTPNLDGAGHGRFGCKWMPLDPPRHLFLYSPPALLRLGRRADFTRCEVRTSAARAYNVGLGSLEIERLGRHDRLAERSPPSVGLYARALSYQYAAWFAVRHAANAGDECVFRAVKNGDAA